MKNKELGFRNHVTSRFTSSFLCLFTMSAIAVCMNVQANALLEELSPLRFYATKVASPNPNIEFIQQTADVIAKQIAPSKLEFAFLDIPSMEEKIKNKDVDLLVAGAGRYRSNLQYGLRDIGTIVTPLQPNPNYAVGSVILVRGDNKEIQKLADLEGKTVAVNNISGFQGLFIVLNEIFKQGFNPDTFFAKTVPVGMEQIEALELLKNKKVDAAIINSCLAEASLDRGIDILKGFKIINERKVPQINCRVSTDVYPHWSLMITPSMDIDTLNKILVAVNSMNLSVNNGYRWGLASDYSKVDELYKNLKQGTYSYLREWTVKRIWEEYGIWLISAFLIFLGMIVHHIRISYVVQRRTAQLQLALKAQKKLAEKNKTLQEAFEKEKRIAGISIFSRLLAHELAQPLGGILLYAEGMENLMKKPSVICEEERAKLQGTLEKLIKRAEKAQGIVKDIRGFIKGERKKDDSLNLGLLISEVIRDFCELEDIPRGCIVFVPPSVPIVISGNYFDFEVVLLNLFKNSWQAVENIKNPEICVSLSQKANEISIQISDNGPAVEDCLIEQMKLPLFSSQTGEHGLGLSIVRDLCASYGGKLKIFKNQQQRLVVEICLPVTEAKHETQ